LITGNFDLTFRHGDGSEQLCFAIPAGLCGNCDELHINPALVATLELESARLVFAIETDRVAQKKHLMRAE
jgi:hypothetical protein